MAFGFVCFELDGTTPQNISAIGSPAFVRALPPSIAPLGGSRCYFQGVAPGLPPYASTTTTRAALVAGLVASSPSFLPVDFIENEPAPAPTITLNGAGEVASLSPLDAAQLAPGVPAAVRVTYSAGVYCDVQGTITTVAAALAAGGAASAGIVGPAATIYVEPPPSATPPGRGNDATGLRGDASRPFATLNGAFAVMQSGDTVSLAAGTYAPASAPVPASVVSGAIVGPSGPGATYIDATGTGLAALNFSSTGPRVQWNLSGVRFGNQDPGAAALIADGSAAPAGQFFQNGALSFDLCVCEAGGLAFKYCGLIACVGLIHVTPEPVKIETCATVFFLNLLAFGGGPWSVRQNTDDPLNPNGPGNPLQPVRFNGACVITEPATIVLSEQASIYAAPGSLLPTVRGAGLTVSAGLFTSSIVIHGEGAELDLASVGAELPDAQNQVDLTGSIWLRDVRVKLGPGAVSTCRLLGGSASFRSNVECGEGVLGLFQGASFTDSILTQLTTTGTNGRVIPPTFATFPEAVVASPGVSTFSLPFRLNGLDYAVALDFNTFGDAPGACVLRGTSSFDVECVGAANGNVRAIVSYYGNP